MVRYKGMDLPEKTISAIRKYRSLKQPRNYVANPNGEYRGGSAYWPADTIEFLYEQTFPFYDYVIVETFSVKVVGAFYHGNVSREELEAEEKILLD